MADEQTVTRTSKPRTVEGRTFRAEPLSWVQQRWLAEHVFKGRNAVQLELADAMDLVKDHGPMILAICWLEGPQTRGEKGEAGFEPVARLAAWLGARMEPKGILEAVLADFFMLNPGGTLWMLADIRTELAALTEALSVSPTGLSDASVSSPEATSPSADGSSAIPDRLTPSPTCSER